MGFKNFFRKKKEKKSDELSKNLPNHFKSVAEQPTPDPISKEDYLKMREDEEQWLDSHYDFDSIEGINSIPVSKDLPDCHENGVTEEIYYILKQKAYEHEEEGKIALAVTCMKKSIQFAKLKYDAHMINQLEYTLIGMLARNELIQEAEEEKAYADQELILQTKIENAALMQRSIGYALEEKTDLIIAGVQAHASPEMAIYQGRVYSISGKSSKFPALPRSILETGTLNNGEYFPVYPFLDGIHKGDLAYTLECNPIKCVRYAQNIVTFSNRPFLDDRPEEYIMESASINEQLEAKRMPNERYRANIIQIEAERGKNRRNYKWIQENIPEKAPKSYSGYMRMKNGKTKNFLILQEIAAQKGKSI